MKDTHSFLRTGVLVALLFFTPVYTQSIQQWVVENKANIVGYSLIVGALLAYCACRGVLESIKPQQEQVFDWNYDGAILGSIKSQQELVFDPNHDVADDSKLFTHEEDKDSLVGQNLNPVIFNGQNINDIIKRDEWLHCESPEEAHFLSFTIKNGVIEVGSFSFADVSAAQEDFNYLDQKKSSFTQMHAGKSTRMAGGSLNHNGMYMTAKEAIILEGRSSIEISNGLYISPKIELIGNKMEFKSCYIDTDELIIKINSPRSYCKIIRITFDKNSVIPAGLRGSIDFANNETLAESGLWILGAKTIEIQFALHAFC